jgi:hypothetical protein
MNPLRIGDGWGPSVLGGVIFWQPTGDLLAIYWQSTLLCLSPGWVGLGCLQPPGTPVVVYTASLVLGQAFSNFVHFTKF